MNAGNEATKKKSKNLRFNSIDIVIVLAVILCVVWAVLRYNNYRSEQKEALSDTALVSVLSVDTMEELYSAVNTGDTVYLDDDGRISGTVTDKSYRNDEEDDAVFTIELKGKMTDEGFYVNGNKHIAAGTETSMFSDKYVVNIQIIDVKQKNS